PSIETDPEVAPPSRNGRGSRSDLRKKKNPASPSGKAGYTKSKAGGRKGRALLTVSPASQIFSSPGSNNPHNPFPQTDGTRARARPLPTRQPITNCINAYTLAPSV